MRINILTLFPEMFESLNTSILKRALDKNLIEIKIYNIRDYTLDKHKKCDDYTFGGGAGMIMTPQPIDSTFEAFDKNHNTHRIYMSPKGKTLNQEKVEELAKFDEITILCGHYEGIDERIIEMHIDEQISIGDYVLTGGEIPCMVLIDSVSRYVEGVLGSDESTNEESFSTGLLEYPQYTRPQNFKGYKVPDVLLSGNHEEIRKWREKKQLELTKALRPDLLKNKNDE